MLTPSVRIIDDLSRVDAADWDRLDHGGSPFLESGFLRALELSGSVGPDSGWRPRYLLAEVGGGAARRLVGAVAAYVKDHSYGEYIFDWGWAHASERAGIPYYPKLVVAAPMTPATGRRILLSRDADAAVVSEALIRAVRELADAERCRSVHWLFTTAAEQELLVRHGYLPRASYQFHWRNRGYAHFDDFLARMTSRKRKQIRKERARARGGFDELVFVPGGELAPATVDNMDRFYRATTYAHGGIDYLEPGFFHALVRLAPERIAFADVRRGGRTIAGAIFLETERTLYGRYWGADVDVDLLHFETAYYAGIERCIERGVPLFEAGAQGEHKLLRGFEPSPTYSAHWIRHPELSRAVAAFLREEAREVPVRMRRLAELGPYRRDLPA